MDNQQLRKYQKADAIVTFLATYASAFSYTSSYQRISSTDLPKYSAISYSANSGSSERGFRYKLNIDSGSI